MDFLLKISVSRKYIRYGTFVQPLPKYEHEKVKVYLSFLINYISIDNAMYFVILPMLHEQIWTNIELFSNYYNIPVRKPMNNINGITVETV